MDVMHWARAEWPARRAIHYWGDIDTHGFAILDQLRGRFPRVASFLMDRPTLMVHDPYVHVFENRNVVPSYAVGTE